LHFQICPKNIEHEDTEGNISIKTEEKIFTTTVKEVDARGCFGGKIEKEVRSQEPEIKLTDIVQFGVHAKFEKSIHSGNIF